MTESRRPESPEEVGVIIREAAAKKTPIEVLGQGSKRAFGRPLKLEIALDLSRLSGIRLYEPNELVMTAGVATPLAEIAGALAQNRQELAFEPADLGLLYGGEADRGSIGGAFACNLSGPRRFKAGAARDHLLGFHAVSGWGESFKSGGRVVKNVTGYDLCKLMCGSFGTLAVLTDVTFKVLPKAEETRTLLLFGQDDDTALTRLRAAAAGANEVSGLAHLPIAVAKRSTVGEVAGAHCGVSAFRIEGPAPSVAARMAALKAEIASTLEVAELTRNPSLDLWREIRDVSYFASAETVLWRLSLTPTAAAPVLARLTTELADDTAWFYDWAGGLAWLEIAGAAQAETVHAAVTKAGGHGTLIRATLAERAVTAVFQPQPRAVAALSRRIKESFDPDHILNPGRMYAGL
jgi:glycolate oxidase FAD binding subunit